MIGAHTAVNAVLSFIKDQLSERPNKNIGHQSQQQLQGNNPSTSSAFFTRLSNSTLLDPLNVWKSLYNQTFHGVHTPNRRLL